LLVDGRIRPAYGFAALQGCHSAEQHRSILCDLGAVLAAGEEHGH
jgi:hypothetical protein